MQKKSFENFSGRRCDISSSVVNLCDFNVEKTEINVKEHNLKEQFKETTERMIQQNNMEIMSKRLVDNVI